MERELQRLLRTVSAAGRGGIERVSDPVDQAAEWMRLEAETALAERTASEVAELTSALRRLRDEPDQYGRCAGCRELIPVERLEILPTVQHCVQCP